MDTIQIINHIYANRPRTIKAEERQTPMNLAFLRAAVEKVQEEVKV